MVEQLDIDASPVVRVQGREVMQYQGAWYTRALAIEDCLRGARALVLVGGRTGHGVIKGHAKRCLEASGANDSVILARDD